MKDVVLRPPGPRLTQRTGHRVHRAGGAMAEERERDVKMVASERAGVAAEGVSLPVDERVERLVGKGESAEEPDPFTAHDAISATHAGSSRLCDTRRRTRWSAATDARRRTDSRSAGKLNSMPRGVSACA